MAALWGRGKSPKTMTCEVTGQVFEVSKAEQEAYRHFDLPIPKMCPEERMRRQLAFRSQPKFFWRTCSASSEKIFSVFAPGVRFPVVGNDYWRSDEWDAEKFGRDFDFQGFFFRTALRSLAPSPAACLSSTSCNRLPGCAQRCRCKQLLLGLRLPRHRSLLLLSVLG